MDPLTFTEVVLSGIGIGLISSLTGVGGGILTVPLMVLLLGVDAKIAVASSLLTVIVTSASSSAVYLKEGFVNMKAALILEPSTALGAIAGALITISLPSETVKRAFGLALIAISLTMFLRAKTEPGGESKAKRWIPGIVLSFFAGVTSGMFGVGGGVIKVPVMNLVMDIPIKEAVATSSLMVGLTASSGSIVYALKGFVDPSLVLGFSLGILPGATLGAKILKGIRSKYIKIILSLVLLYAGIKLLG